MDTVEKYYDTQYDEWSRLDRHRIEFEITRRVLDQYVKRGSEVLDVGGGPGRYSIYLARQGCEVTLLDLSGVHIQQALQKTEEAGVRLKAAIKGNALELDRLLPEKIYDAVLCMGPLYHLLEEEERRKAIEQCTARLKPGGILIASFISAYAPVVDYMIKNPEGIREHMRYFLEYFKDGRNRKEFGFTDAYFIDPERAEQLFDGSGLEKLRFMAVEGLGNLRESSLMAIEEEAFQCWMDLLYEISEHRAVLGSCCHLLYIGRKG